MLAVMVGGEPHQLDSWKKTLDGLGDVTLVGPVGRAASLKLALNQLIGSLVTAFATSLVFAQREGVPTDLFLRVLRGSALYAQAFDKKLPKMESHEFGKPNFTTSLLLKDLELFVKAAQWDKLDVRGVEAVCELLRRAIQMGHGDDDYSSVFVAVERAPGS
jgi:3-hydroxyisobutyrate dehydrogenase-like beta-hydroxyacid dehydrogenase